MTFDLFAQPYPKGENAPCGIGDHRWLMVIEEGQATIQCVDPCSPEKVEATDPSASLPACLWVPDCVDMLHGEVAITPVYDRGPRDWETGVYDDPDLTFEIEKEPT